MSKEKVSRDSRDTPPVPDPPSAPEVNMQKIIEDAVRIGVEAGVAAAEKVMSRGKNDQEKSRYKRRLHNTRLLLANYRELKEHVSGAIFDSRKTKESALDILDSLDREKLENNLYIESIRRSQQRTMIILAHIDQMLEFYRISCEQSGREDELRRYKILYAAYIAPERKSAEQIAEENMVEKRTYYSDLGKAIKPLSALLFGIDGLRFS